MKNEKRVFSKLEMKKKEISKISMNSIKGGGENPPDRTEITTDGQGQ